ncbi:ATP-binding protein [Deltaproteobacteria bacterium TL4]
MPYSQQEHQLEKMREGILRPLEMSDDAIASQIIQILRDYFQERGDPERCCRVYSRNHILTREGQKNEFLWIIVSGSVICTKKGGDDIDREVLREGPGALVGLISFVRTEPAFISTKTLNKTEVIKLDRKTLDEVLKVDAEFMPLFTTLLLRHLTRRLKNSIHIELKLQETLKSLDSAQLKLIQSEKMAILGQLVAGVAHELNNPVSAIIRGVENLKNDIPLIVTNLHGKGVMELGARVLRQANTVTPLSTAVIRERTESALKWFKSHTAARKAVMMQIDSQKDFNQYFQAAGDPLDSTIEYLDRFYQVGSFLRNIEVCGSRIANLVKGLKNYSHQDHDIASLVNIQEGIEDTLVIFSNKLKTYEVLKDYQPIPQVEGYPSQLNQVWTNLIANAIEAMGGKGSLTIRTHMAPSRPDGMERIQVCIEDNGPGIPHDLLQKLFELNYTTKREGHFGLGLGLAICQQIAEKHEGWIEVTSEVGAYTRFTITLPAHHKEG